MRRYRFNSFEAENITLDSLMKIINKLYQLKDPKKFESWSWTVLRRTSLDYIRQNKKYKDNIVEEAANISGVVKEVMETKENTSFDKQKCVQLGLQKFEKSYPDAGEALSMRMLNIKYKDIGIRIGRTEAAAKELVSKSKEKLAPFIKHCLEED